MAILSISSSLRNIFNILRGLVESSGRMFTPGVLVKLNLLFDRTGLSQLALDPPCPGLLPAPTPWPRTELAAVPWLPPRVRILLPVSCLTVPPLVLTYLCVGEVIEVSLLLSDEAVMLVLTTGEQVVMREEQVMTTAEQLVTAVLLLTVCCSWLCVFEMFPLLAIALKQKS